MKAIILAAGYATRLYPLTKDRPKPLLPINGKPIINFIVEEINTLDEVSEIIVVTNEKFFKPFDAWSKTVESRKPVSVINDGTFSEDDRKGAIGDIQFVIDSYNIDEELLIIAGDNLFTFKLLDSFKYYKNVGCDCVVAKTIDDENVLKQFAVARLDAKDMILELVEKPEKPNSNVGVFATYIYTRETVSLIKTYLDEGNKPDAPGYFVQWLYKKKDVYAYIMDGECYDVGTIAAYELVQTKF